MSDNADVPRGRRPSSNAIVHADLERRRGGPESTEQGRPTNVTAVDGGVTAIGAVDRLGPADNTRQNMNEWTQAKTSFASVMDDADAVVRMFDQEKKHIIGLTQALSQIQDSFEKLHSRFTDVESRVESFETISGRLGYRLESTFDAVQEYKNSQAELVKNQLDLRAALETAERKWAALEAAERKSAEHTDSIRALSDENRQLREALAGMARDNKLMVAEIANIHSKIALLEEQVDTESLFVRTEPHAPHRAAPQRERVTAVPHEPRRVLQDAAAAIAADGDYDKQLSDLNDSIAYHRHELSRMQAEAEMLAGRFADTEGSARHAAFDAGRDAETAGSSVKPERKLNELQALASSYQSLLADLEKSRAALARRGADMDDGLDVPEAQVAETSEPPRGRSSHPLAGATEYNKINSVRSMYEKRTEDLKAELVQERRERKFAECALRVARAERLHLQHELAKVRAMGWRKITPDAPSEPAPSHEPEAVKRRFSAA